MIELTRRHGFAAAHILSQPFFSAEENLATYGKCANPNGHGHNYGVEITVTAPIDERTGRILSPLLLARTYVERVEARFARQLLNHDEAFRAQEPTAENIALVIHEILADEVAKRSSAEVVRIKIVETRNNSCSSGAIE